MRIAFMGTPDFSVSALQQLVSAGHDIVAVYSQPPRPAGRGKKLQKSAVHRAAEAMGIEVRTPVSLKSEDEQAAFRALDLDCAVVVAYGLLLPKAILDAPKYGCLNIHASLLPRWRGAAPIHRAIMAGDKVTGVCIMQMDEGLDTGDVILREEIEIRPEDTTASLHDKLSEMGGRMIVSALQSIADGTATHTVQPEEGITYAHKIDKAEAKIDWNDDATTIERQIRGLVPFPGAWTDFDGSRLKILEASVEQGSGDAGVALDDQLLIACGSDALRLGRVQKAGKGAVDAAQFLTGHTVPAGTRFVGE
ncbi:methionyl-tRNA formyltransferase [Kordiimonas sediminis]|uniref:Methionyl-tRNA formyltransferase n=1 Tax=Kordiimonas sediminis TaxID=1735581 RepID=A0A919AN57_9PROT|nr:methionyl-tRNA formyltransferase [Kordiimonas sediminis]GHF15920.1 methionyl-tRNA formyltransferase [Kordiimonas sediminis]